MNGIKKNTLYKPNALGPSDTSLLMKSIRFWRVT
jgi:hypothetical protein